MKKKQKTLLEIIVPEKEDNNIIEEIMKEQDVFENLLSVADENAMRLIGYDKAIIGVDNDGRLVYDFEKMISILKNNENWDREECIDWLHYNTLCVKDERMLSPVFIMV